MTYQDEQRTIDAALEENAPAARHANAGQPKLPPTRAERARDASIAHIKGALQRVGSGVARRHRAGRASARVASRLHWTSPATPDAIPPSLRRLSRISHWLITLQLRRLAAAWHSARAPSPASRVPGTLAWSLTEAEYDRWVRACDTLTATDRAAIVRHVGRLTQLPVISVVVTACDTEAAPLHATIASVRAQLYPHWELCVIDAGSAAGVSDGLRAAAADDRRIRLLCRELREHGAASRNAALARTDGAFVTWVAAGDQLAEHALYEVAVALNAHPNSDLIYTDEDQLRSDGRRVQPYFKPDWSLDLLLGHNLFNHLGVMRRALVEQVGGFREDATEGSEDYDLVLRCAAASDPARIRHIPAVLYHRRPPVDAAPPSPAPADCAGGRRAVADYLKQRGVAGAEVTAVPCAPAWNRVRWPLPDPPPLVSLIVPTRDRPELLARCAAGVLQRTDYPSLELLIVDNDSTDPETLALLSRLQDDHRVRVLKFPGPFNYAALNNAAVRAASGDIVVLVNNDIDVCDGGWLREMVGLLARPDVGAVGAKLRFADDRIQHAGVVLGVGDAAIAGHFGYCAPDEDAGYFGQLALTREVSAVTGACLGLRKSVYDAVGGLDAENLPVSYNDVDLCLRIRERGWRVIWTPFAELYHLESASRGSDQTPERRDRGRQEVAYMRRRWGEVLDRDPFYNPNFDRLDHGFRLAFPPGREKPWRGG